MFNPLSLRLCCLATMAPALTSEAATRARDKLPGAPTPPSVQASLVNGRDCQMNSSSKGGGDFGTSTLPTSIPKKTQIVALTKDLQKKLAETGHLVGDCGFQVVEQKGSVHAGLVNLTAIKNILNPQQLNQLITSVTNCTMASKSHFAASSNTSSTVSAANGITNTSTASVQKPLPNKMLQSGAQRPPIQIQPPTAAAKSNQISKERVEHVNDSGPSYQPSSASQKIPEARDKPALSNGFHGMSQSKRTNDGALKHAAQTATTSSIRRDSVIVVPSTVSKSGLHSTNQLLENVARRQRQLETRTNRLLRQLRRLQSRQAISHNKQQLCGLVESQQQALHCRGKNRTDIDMKTELLQSQNAKNMSTAALVSLIQRWQCAQPTSLRHQLSTPPQEHPDPVTRLDDDTCAELDRVSGHLSSNLAHLQEGLDSDATESSSGGESCEEWDYDDDWDGKMSRPPIQCRMEWKWANDRAAVAARWTWLQAQVSDLEYRIRQQYDIYKQIRTNKGSVTLGEHPPPEDLMSKGKSEKGARKMSPLEEKIATLQAKNDMSPANISTLLSNVDKQSNRLTQQIGPLYTPHQSPVASTSSGSSVATPKTPNGFVDNKPMCITPDDAPGVGVRTTGFDPCSPAPDSTCQAARCRPVRSYRKRKLLRTAGLYNANRKAARLSSVSCHCYPPVAPCVMCGGRHNNTLTMEPETSPYMEKVALVDISFHPVLSFPQDVSLTTHFESMLKTGEWQQKPHPRASYKVLHTEPNRRSKLKEVRKYTRKIKKNTSATIVSSTKIRNKYELKQLCRNQMGSPVKVPPGGECTKLSRAEIRLKKRKAALQNNGNNHQKGLVDCSTPGGSTYRDMLSPGLPSMSLKELWQKRRRERGENAYDINNIVIPYSIASSTRVEKLQYKEILTPKWREICDTMREEALKLKRSNSCGAIPEVVQVPTPTSPDVKAEPVPLVAKPETTANKDTEPTSILHQDDQDDEDEIEDLSDESYRVRHVRCEISEKKRFSTVLPAMASSLRRSRGAQRTDSTASTTTTELYCPETTTTAEGSLVSQVVTPPSTPAPPTPLVMPAAAPDTEDLGHEAGHRRDSSASTSDNVRTRSSSVSSSKSVRSRSASCSEERALVDRSFGAIPPWPLRDFPLSGDDWQTLEQREESKENAEDKRERTPEAKVITEEMAPSSVPVSPIPSQSDSNSEVVEDPDDPEWTVISERSIVTKQPNIVLKLAKR